MPTSNHSRVGFWLFAMMLLGLLTQAAFADDADAGRHEGDPSSKLSAAPSSAQTSSSENAASESATKSADDIDTRISVQTRRTSAKPGKVGEAKAKLSLPGVKNPHRRVFSASAVSRQTVRNAVGVPISQQELLERHAGEHPFAASTPHIPAGAIGVVGNTGVGVAKPDVGLIRQTSLPPSTSPGVNSPVVNRGISGTSMSHRGVGPSGLGGPAKTAAGINGTMIRPTH
jgi:hypothetical protein